MKTSKEILLHHLTQEQENWIKDDDRNLQYVTDAMEEYANERVNNAIELFGHFCRTLNEAGLEVNKLSKADVIKSVCYCGRELDAMDFKVGRCYECSKTVPQTVL